LIANLSYDYLRRLTSVVQSIGSASGASATYSYDDTHFIRTASVAVDTAKAVQQIAAPDGLGRPNLSTTEDASNNVYAKVATQYDLLDRPYQVSNPYTGTAASYWTTTQFDSLGRPTSVTLPDNSATVYTYATNTATSADPTGKQRKVVIDAAGRLSSVWEPDPTNNNSLTLQTSYAFNVLDELTSVVQGVQARTFAYDALGRINSVTTPEAGRVCFGTVSGSTCQANGYDSFDNLLYRTDARGVQTNFIYDSLNRLLGASYSNVPSSVSAMPNVCATTGSQSNNANVCFTYGTSAASFNNGRLVTMADPTGSASHEESRACRRGRFGRNKSSYSLRRTD
jgi:YD repeat-containing protein